MKTVQKNDEAIILALRELYTAYGYRRYKMSRFEPYDLYAENKSFLVSDSVITFNDPDGHLLALKPDVTLSIVKNARDGETAKLYYNESVFRTSKSSREYREIMQTGLEYIGDADLYAVGEVISLAVKSLSLITDNFMLDISHMGFLSAMLDYAGLDELQKSEIFALAGEKNSYEIRKKLAAIGADSDFCERMVSLVGLYGPLGEMLAQLREISLGENTDAAIAELCGIYEILDSEGLSGRVNLDFSIVNDMSYYTGVIFQGYIEGIPSYVLSGGRYDKLLQKFSKSSGAVGFALYLDMLERLYDRVGEYDTDIFLLYGECDSAICVSEAVSGLIASGVSVTAGKTVPDKLKYKRLIKLGETEIQHGQYD